MAFRNVNKQSGQTLSEYVLAGALVAMVGLGALVTLSGTLQANLPGWLDTVFGMHAPVPPAASPPNPAPSGSQAPEPSPIAPDTEWVLQLKDTGFDLKNSVETAGANGTSERLLAELESVIRQLEAAGELDAEQAGLLYRLANQGHRMASIEKTIEDTARQYTGNSSGYNTVAIQFDGKSYPIGDFALLIGWSHNQMGNVPDPLNYDTGAGTELSAFIDLYRQAKSSGALENPAAERVVSSLAADIALLGELVQGSHT